MLFRKKRTLDFVVGGVQKGGTTALYDRMRRHPKVFLAPKKKELHFFDDEKRAWPNPDYKPLFDYFEGAPKSKLWGDITPSYLFWPNAIDRILELSPKAKLIFIFRHPVFRAVSHWKMIVTRERETNSFEYAISQEGRARVTIEKPRDLRSFSYIERGFYGAQVQELLTKVPREQCLFLTTEMLWNDEAETLSKIWKFLGVKDVEIVPEKKVVVPVETRHVETPDKALTRPLFDLYAEDIDLLQELTGLDVARWKDPDYSERVRS